MWIFCPPNPLKLSAGMSHHEHYTIVSIVSARGEVNMAALWVAVSGGRARERVLTDANLFCVHALMCVNSQSRPWDQWVRAWITSTVWVEPSSWRRWHDAMAAVDTRPSPSPPPLSSLIIHQLLTFTRWGINQRWQTTVTTSQRGHRR